MIKKKNYFWKLICIILIIVYLILFFNYAVKKQDDLYTLYVQLVYTEIVYLQENEVLTKIYIVFNFFLKAAWFLGEDTPRFKNFPLFFKRDWVKFIKNRYPLSIIFIGLLIYKYLLNWIDVFGDWYFNKLSFRKAFLLTCEMHYNFLVLLSIPILLMAKLQFFPAIFWCKLYAKAITLIACWKNGVIKKERPIYSIGVLTLFFMLVELYFYYG